MSPVSRLALVALAAALLPALAHAAPDEARWGLYGRLASAGAWAHKLSSGGAATARYTWVRPNEELRAEHRLEGTDVVTVETITPGPEAGKLTVLTQDNDQSEPSRSVVTLNPDGTAVETFTARSGVLGRATYTMVGTELYQARTEAQVDGEWREVFTSLATPMKE